MKRLLLAAVGLLGLYLPAVGVVFAEATVEPGAITVAPISAADKRFLLEMAAGGMSAIELGTLARDIGQSADVRELAQRMIENHGKANNELRGLAQKKGVNLPSELPAKYASAKDRLAPLTGPAFEKKYLQQLVRDLEATVVVFEKAASDSKDAELRAWSWQMLPMLRSELKRVHECEERVAAMKATSLVK